MHSTNKSELTGETPAIIERFFRHEYGKVVAHLTKKFGTDLFELVEDSVQEAMIKAMQVWPYKEVPQNPRAWILTVAKNKLIDVLRREAKKHQGQSVLDVEEFDHEAQSPIEIQALDNELNDDLLGMMFACCHPLLKEENQIILSLRILCGFGNPEVASALLKNEDAVAKAYTRAKTKLRQGNILLEVPRGNELDKRLAVVLRILYLLFNEGYKTASGDLLLRKDLCLEAIRLTNILLENKTCAQPDAHSLLALMYFHFSRSEARQLPSGELITLEHQDRSLWNHEMINLGTQHLTQADSQHLSSEYHIQASIAACHCYAESFSATNWQAILNLYDAQMQIRANPIIALNRVVALSKVQGAAHALKELKTLEHSKALDKYYLHYAIKSQLFLDIGNKGEAVKYLKRAIELVENKAEKAHMVKKMEAISGESIRS